VLEYLWHAAYAFEAPGTDEAEKWVENRLHALLSGHSAAQMGTSLRGMIECHALDAKAAKPVEKCIKYLASHATCLHYDRALADGLPIATCVIEGACRFLVQDRMGRSGARWCAPAPRRDKMSGHRDLGRRRSRRGQAAARWGGGRSDATQRQAILACLTFLETL
jgi:hypothetical protein